MTFIETRIAVLRFLKTRPDGTGAKFSELCRVVQSSHHSVYDALEDLEATGTVICMREPIPRQWRLATPAEYPAEGLNRLLAELGV